MALAFSGTLVVVGGVALLGLLASLPRTAAGGSDDHGHHGHDAEHPPAMHRHTALTASSTASTRTR